VAVKDKKTKVTIVSKIVKPHNPKNKFIGALYSVGGYFKGSWLELRKVRWPNRRSTWGMTAAVLMFTGLFLALIVSLDAMFSQLFNLIIK